MKTIYKKDPLLLAGRIATYFLMAVFAIAFASVAFGLVAVPFGSDQLAEKLLEEGSTSTVNQVMPRILALLGCVALLMAAAFRFTQLLGKMIGSVGEGDPFIPENADRLSIMGWLALAFQILLLPISILASWLARNIGDTNVDIGEDVSLIGFLLVLVLFILARVFRKGTEMRDELEGTV